jgi:hypothetical protein
MTQPEPGQVWRPTVPGRAVAKLVLRLSYTGGVYAVRYPSAGRNLFPKYHSPEQWQAWAETFGAAPEGRAAQLAATP